MKVINIFAGPGAGKSTTAAMVFAQMKYRGDKVELVTEYAKDKVWEKSFNVLGNQLYVFGKQHHRLWRLQDEVEYVVTDSPLALSLYYGKACGTTFRQLVIEEHNRWPSLNIVLDRAKPYLKYGRNQTENEAKEVDREIVSALQQANIVGYHVLGDERAPYEILSLLDE